MAQALATTEIYGVRLITDGDRVLSAHQKRPGGFEPELVREWVVAVGHGAVIDVGAYTGLYTLLAARAGSAVYAFEPNPNNYRRLMQNAHVNTSAAHIKTFPYAASDSDCFAEFHAGSFGGLTSAGTLHKQPRMTQSKPVKCVRLDAVVPEGAPIVAIKLDAERHELQALMGAERILRQWQPRILCEILEREDPAPIVDYLAGFGYTGRKVATGGWVFTC